MNRKKIAVLISAVLAVAAAVTAVIVFRRQIAAFLQGLEARLQSSRRSAPAPDFTDEERESFADI